MSCSVAENIQKQFSIFIFIISVINYKWSVWTIIQ